MSTTRTPSRAGKSGKPADTGGAAAKQQQLQGHEGTPATTGVTTNQGVAIPDNHNALKAGIRGPSLLEDFILREKITHFDHERIPERVVHARGAAAHGTFKLYKSLATYTRADFLNDTEVETPVFVRFSTVAGSRGSADTVRDVRGFAVKFYTREGNFDLVGNNIPVFFIQDAMKFPDLIHAVKPEPHNEIPQAQSAHDTFWDFASLMPETTHMLMWAMSDRAIPRSYRMMEGFGVHTFRLVNARGDSHLVKWHWKPKLGVHGLAWDEAQKLAGKDPDFHRRDLHEAIEAGNFPEWELGVQIVDEAKADTFGFDLLDATKLIPEEMVPVMPVGRMVLNRNPANYFAETEQVAFHPGHLVPGMDFTADPLLQGRLFSYTDTQLSRLGGPNFHEIPINRPVCPFHNFQRDGIARQTINPGRVAYEPNSLGQERPLRVDGGNGGFQSVPERIESPKVRGRSPSFDDHFTQAALFYNSLSQPEREHVARAFTFELMKVETPAVRQRMVDNLAHVDPKLAKKVAAPLGLLPDARAAEGQSGFRSTRIVLPIEESPALSMAVRPNAVKGIPTRKVALLVADGTDGASYKPLAAAIVAAGGQVKVIGPHLGTVKTAGNRQLAVDATFATMPSIAFDAVLIGGGQAAADALVRNGDAVHYVLEAYKHGKAVCALAEGVTLLQGLGIQPNSEAQSMATNHPGVLLGVGIANTDNEALTALGERFVAAIAQHRFWDRPLMDAVPA